MALINRDDRISRGSGPVFAKENESLHGHNPRSGL